MLLKDDPLNGVRLALHFRLGCIPYSGAITTDSDADTYNEAAISPFLNSVPRDSFTVATKFMPSKWDNKCDYATVVALAIRTQARARTRTRTRTRTHARTRVHSRAHTHVFTRSRAG